MTSRIPLRPGPSHRSSRSAEPFAVTVVCVVVALMAGRLDGAGHVATAFDVLACSAAGASTILLGVTAALNGKGTAGRIALASGALTVYLAVRPFELGGTILRDTLLAAMAVVLLSVVLQGDAPARGREVVLGVGLVAVAVGSVPDGDSWVVVVVVGVAVGAATAAVSAGLVVTGVRHDRPLLRWIGLAVGLISAAHLFSVGYDAGALPVLVAVLELSGMLTLTGVALHALLVAIGSVWRQQEEWQSELAAAAAAAAAGRDRDHEMRNLLLGLSGAARVLTLGAPAHSPGDAQLLQAAASAEIERLRQLLDGGAECAQPAYVQVGPLLRELAAVHRAGGLDVHLVEVDDGLHARITADALAQIVTNLLVNCARHAPGARVRMRAGRTENRIVLRVADDGPGLPAGYGDELLARGATGPSSTGDGLGLAIAAALVSRCDGVLRFEPTWPERGCTVVVEVPSARRPVGLREPVIV